MDKISEKIEYLMEKCPEKVVEFARHMYKHDPEAVERMLETFEDDGHLTNKRKYDELIQKVKWTNGNGKGERWNFEDVKKASKIDFANVDYTEFDFAYLVNMLYAKCCKEFTDMSFYIKLAKCLLEDKDEETKVYRGAYSNNKKHSQRGAQNYYNENRSYNENRGYDDYDDYNEENRRRRRYRSERMDDYENRSYNEDNRYSDRRSYNEYQDRGGFFRQN
ncbi:MAG: hypothetical protein NC408_04510 [Candidatus Gastranaerophilales bacterium]|nr:hypothetical protein [Candidatus Gastranaerophilales bacterium]MCM1072266.1 hypothetical protein [Bacteroides sp.]